MQYLMEWVFYGLQPTETILAYRAIEQLTNIYWIHSRMQIMMDQFKIYFAWKLKFYRGAYFQKAEVEPAWSYFNLDQISDLSFKCVGYFSY